MSTPVLNNGIFLRDTTYKVSSHLDSFHLKNLLGRQEPMDLGPVDLWAMSQRVQVPLYQMGNFGGKNVIEVTGAHGEYKWSTPIVQDLPYIVENIEENTTPGIDGTTFKIKLNKRAYGHGEIISYDKFNGVQMHVVPWEDILNVGDGFIYTVAIPNNDNTRYLDPKYLKPGTKIFSLGSARNGEYGERFNDIGDISGGVREFYNFVGDFEANTHFSISNKADMMAKGAMTTDGSIAVTELWRNFDKNLDPAITTIDELVKQKGKDYVKKAYEGGSLSRTFLTKLEGKHLSKIASDIENYLMWGQGGKLKMDGPADSRLSVGLWKQLDTSFKKIYNKSTFTTEIFRSEIYNFLNGKVEFDGPDPNRQIIVQTGMAGMKMVNEAIKKEALGTGMQVQAADIGAITGSGMNLGFGYSFTSYIIPFLANVKFVLNKAFDNVHTNDIENPIIDGYPLSSYSFIVFDITDNTNDNIFLLKKKWDSELRWWYQNGQMDYMGRSSGFQSSGNFSGYKVFMTQAMPAIWVKDPTKVLKIVMRNPITGGSF